MSVDFSPLGSPTWPVLAPSFPMSLDPFLLSDKDLFLLPPAAVSLSLAFAPSAPLRHPQLGQGEQTDEQSYEAPRSTHSHTAVVAVASGAMAAAASSVRPSVAQKPVPKTSEKKLKDMRNYKAQNREVIAQCNRNYYARNRQQIILAESIRRNKRKQQKLEPQNLQSQHPGPLPSAAAAVAASAASLSFDRQPAATAGVGQQQVPRPLSDTTLVDRHIATAAVAPSAMAAAVVSAPPTTPISSSPTPTAAREARLSAMFDLERRMEGLRKEQDSIFKRQNQLEISCSPLRGNELVLQQKEVEIEYVANHTRLHELEINIYSLAVLRRQLELQEQFSAVSSPSPSRSVAAAVYAPSTASFSNGFPAPSAVAASTMDS